MRPRAAASRPSTRSGSTASAMAASWRLGDSRTPWDGWSSSGCAEGRAVWLGAVGGLVLFLYGMLPTLRPPEAFFGRDYAAYGGVFVVLSLAWRAGPLAASFVFSG